MEFPKHIHFIGIKGSGMAALATLLAKRGHVITGSDISDSFYTDALLQAAHIPYVEQFSPDNISNKTQLVIYSAAYSAEDNSELAYAQKTLQCLSYPQALGVLSQMQETWAIIGTHGKTTTSSFIGALCKAHNLPVSVITGASMEDFNNNASWHNGDKALFSEVCEYKNHFQEIKACSAVFTSAEYDHPDYFENEDAVFNSFSHFLNSLSYKYSQQKSIPKIIACYDDKGVETSISKIKNQNNIYWYGFSTSKENNTNNTYIKITYQGIQNYQNKRVQSFQIKGLHATADSLTWYIPMPAQILILNAVAALITIFCFAKDYNIPIDWNLLHKAFVNFKGIIRRSQIIYTDKDITILDDYGHHPTAIKKTLKGIKNFYEPKRLIVAFMSHTYSRTDALWQEFCHCFEDADEIIINEIYSSARNDISNNSMHNAKNLAKEIASYSPNKKQKVSFIDSFEKSAQYLYTNKQAGDVIVTMGAGDNFRISHKLKEMIESN